MRSAKKRWGKSPEGIGRKASDLLFLQGKRQEEGGGGRYWKRTSIP